MSVAKSIGTAKGGEGVRRKDAYLYTQQGIIYCASCTLLHRCKAPPHHYVVPSPYKQGESAMRNIYTVNLYYLASTTFNAA